MRSLSIFECQPSIDHLGCEADIVGGIAELVDPFAGKMLGDRRIGSEDGGERPALGERGAAPSTTIKPRFLTGANTPERVPTTTDAAPARMRRH